MSSKQPTVLELAKEAGIDPELALLTLWEAGMGELQDPTARLDRRTAALARRILCLPSRAQINTPEYWQRQFGVSGDQFWKVLTGLGISATAKGRKLPKGSVRLLRRALIGKDTSLELLLHKSRKEKEPCISDSRILQQEEDSQSIPFVWREVGHRIGQEIRALTFDQIMAVHWKLVDDFENTTDPIKPPGLRSRSLLESAIYRIQTSLGHEKKYPTIEMATAALLHSLVLNHPFINGNKRTALVCMLAMLDMNGLLLTCSESDLFKMVIRVAQHKIVVGRGRNISDRETLGIADWITQNSRWIEKGERPIPWRRLRRILVSFGCELDFPGGVGNRINISRKVPDKKAGRKKTKELSVQVHYGDMGSEVERDTLNHIRHKLELDEDHNIDSACFYGRSLMESEDFIGLYRKILRQLAKL